MSHLDDVIDNFLNSHFLSIQTGKSKVDEEQARTNLRKMMSEYALIALLDRHVAAEAEAICEEMSQDDTYVVSESP